MMKEMHHYFKGYKWVISLKTMVRCNKIIYSDLILDFHDVCMTSCSLTFFFMCACSSWYIRLLTCRQSFIYQSWSQSEQYTWIVTFGCVRLAKAVRCISPSPSSVLPCQFSFPFIHVSSPKTTFMTKHGLIPSKWCLRIPKWNPQILQRYHSDGSREEETHFALRVSGTGSRRHWAEKWEKPDIIKDL